MALSTAPLPAERPSPALPRRRLLVILNPAAGQRHGRRFRATLALLDQLGCQVTLKETSAPGDATRLAGEIKPGEFDVLVAAGGDGTINEILNGMVGTDLALAILPLGTANVLAAEIGLDLTPRGVAETIVHGRQRPVACGKAGERYFTQMAGVGFDAHVVAGVGLALKRRIGKGAYVVEAVRQGFVFGHPRYRVTVDGEVHEAASVIVANGRHYAGRYLLAPEASIEDPHFQVCLFLRSGPLAVTRYGLALQTGRLPYRSDLKRFPGRHVKIEGPSGDPVQGDGDIVARLPVEVSVQPDAVELVFAAEVGAAGV